MPPTAVVVANPAAGRGRPNALIPRLLPIIRSRFPLADLVMTTGPGHATAIARDAAAGGVDRIICLGGDGTLRELTDGLVHTDVVLGIIPAGTGNDLCRTLNIPSDPAAAAELAVSTRQPVSIDVSSFNGRHCVNVVGAGFDAEVARAKNERFHRFKGTVPFLMATLATLASYRNALITLHHDQGTLSGRSLLFAAANGKYYGGGMKVAPHADPTDGLLDIVIAWDLNKLETLSTIPKIYSGRHVSHRKVTVLRTRTVTVLAETPVSVQADGEVLGRLPITVTAVPRALRVMAVL